MREKLRLPSLLNGSLTTSFGSIARLRRVPEMRESGLAP